MSRATVVETAGGLAVELPKSAGLKAGAAFHVASFGPDGALLLREGAAPNGFFAGELAAFSISEVFGQIFSGVRTGKLIVASAAARRAISFKDGQITFASSTEAHERLGRSLVRRKLVSARQLEDALGKVKPGRKLGQVLTGEKIITASALYAAMADLVKEITLGLFELDAGHFAFFDGAPVADDALKLPERTKELLLLGVKRAEEIARLRRKLSPAMRVAKGAAKPAEHASLVERAGAGAELSDLQAKFEGSAHAFLTAVDALLASGALVAQKPAAAAKPSTPIAASPQLGALELYQKLIRTIADALKAQGRDLSDLRSFLSDPLPGSEQAFAKVTLSDDGVLDVKRVLDNMKAGAKGDDAVARATAYEALDSFVSYALFSAKNVLPPEVAQSLTAEFKRLREGHG